MNSTPVANRMHISIFGKRNAGKSTLINALTGQNIAVVSNVPGTTTDPVNKTMELLPIGPVVIIDTAGIDDVGELGNLRLEKTYNVLRKTDLAIYVINAVEGIDDFDQDFIRKIKEKNITVIAVINKSDLKKLNDEEIIEIKKKVMSPIVNMNSAKCEGIEELKRVICQNAKFDDTELSLVGDLIQGGDLVVLVTPIDKSAPKGRLILPQQQTIRDILEKDGIVVMTKEHELKEALNNLKKKPALVITDSQAFLKVSADTPLDIPLTSFSILLARHKGELYEMAKGIGKLKSLKPKSKVLIVEGCTHHKQADDIGTVKIPRWIRQMAGGEIEFEYAHGTSFPKDLTTFDAIIHCGGCMLNGKEMKYRVNLAKEKGVAITNYGMLIAYMQGVLPRALKLFPIASMALEEE